MLRTKSPTPPKAKAGRDARPRFAKNGERLDADLAAECATENEEART